MRDHATWESDSPTIPVSTLKSAISSRCDPLSPPAPAADVTTTGEGRRGRAAPNSIAHLADFDEGETNITIGPFSCSSSSSSCMREGGIQSPSSRPLQPSPKGQNDLLTAPPEFDPLMMSAALTAQPLLCEVLDLNRIPTKLGFTQLK